MVWTNGYSPKPPIQFGPQKPNLRLAFSRRTERPTIRLAGSVLTIPKIVIYFANRFAFAGQVNHNPTNNMKITVTESIFLEQFKRIRPNDFSREALTALFEQLQNIDDYQGEEMELDVIEVCSTWTEFDTALEAAEAHGMKASIDEQEALEFLQKNTNVMELRSGGVVVMNF